MGEGEPKSVKPGQIPSGAHPQSAQSRGPSGSDILKELPSDAPQILAEIPAPQREKVLGLLTSIVVSRHHMGPIPSPEDIAQYNQHIPDGADRIMKMAEKQAEHRIKIESLVISSQQKQSARGQIFGLCIAIIGIVIGAYVALHGHDWVGGGIAGTTVISLVYAFVTGQRAQRKELDRKSQTPPPRS